MSSTYAIADAHDLVAALEPRGGGRAACRICPTTGFTTCDPIIAKTAYSSGSEDQIHGRPGEQHGDAMPDGLAGERAVQFLGRNLALSLIEQLHVAAQGNRGDAIFGTGRRRGRPASTAACRIRC